MKSMNSGTPASLALPECSSLGMIKSASRVTVAYSCLVKNLGWNAVPCSAACCLAACACACAASASDAVHEIAAAIGADVNSCRTFRREMRSISDTQAIALLRDVFAGPHRQGEDRPGDILIGI